MEILFVEGRGLLDDPTMLSVTRAERMRTAPGDSRKNSAKSAGCPEELMIKAIHGPEIDSEPNATPNIFVGALGERLEFS